MRGAHFILNEEGLETGVTFDLRFNNFSWSLPTAVCVGFCPVQFTYLNLFTLQSNSLRYVIFSPFTGENGKQAQGS